ncbi:DUF4192 family protein [Streptomyces sp. NPDC002328]|uniref:DUF4192 domain-containing protein n=1 Tax=Streptomyces sp. NPDC002328 TaxID=3364642 RepID=UPI00368A6DB4
MTNHSETTGSFDGPAYEGRAAYGGGAAYEGHVPSHGGPAGDGDTAAPHQVTLRTPAELADALPYLLGYRPEDSIVLVALHDRGGRGRFGGRARLGIPLSPDDWRAAARQLAQGLVRGSERRGTRPAQMVAYLCQEPGGGGTGRETMERLRPLAQRLREECGDLGVPVIEALCISDGRFWSYCCKGEGCCPAEGAAMGLPGTSVVAAAATYAGIQVRGTLRELRARFLPLETGVALEQEVALDTASMALVPRIIEDASRAIVADETIELADTIMRRFAAAPRATAVLEADRRDDRLLSTDEAAALILGLQDRSTRDRAAQRMEGDEAAPALRLWRALARRCVGPYGEHAAAPLTLAGWVAWSSGDELEAREALAMALGADPDYLFARLLHQACNEGLNPESVRRCLRTDREEHLHGTERPQEAERPRDAVRPEGGKSSPGGGSPLGEGRSRGAERPRETDRPEGGEPPLGEGRPRGAERLHGAERPRETDRPEGGETSLAGEPPLGEGRPRGAERLHGAERPRDGERPEGGEIPLEGENPLGGVTSLSEECPEGGRRPDRRRRPARPTAQGRSDSRSRTRPTGKPARRRGHRAEDLASDGDGLTGRG